MARKVLASLKSILGEAQRRGLVAHNAASPVKVGVNKRENGKLTVGRDIPSKEEVQTILRKAEGRWRPLFATAVFTGMRSSELRGLTWDDVNVRPQGHPRSPARRCLGSDGRAEVGGRGPRDPDGADGRQCAPGMAPGLPEEANSTSSSRTASAMSRSHANIANRGFYALQIEAGIVGEDGRPKYTGCTRCATSARRAIGRGFSPKRLQALLGHASITMTFDRYGHLFPSVEE